MKFLAFAAYRTMQNVYFCTFSTNEKKNKPLTFPMELKLIINNSNFHKEILKKGLYNHAK